MGISIHPAPPTSRSEPDHWANDPRRVRIFVVSATTIILAIGVVIAASGFTSWATIAVAQPIVAVALIPSTLKTARKVAGGEPFEMETGMPIGIAAAVLVLPVTHLLMEGFPPEMVGGLIGGSALTTALTLMRRQGWDTICFSYQPPPSRARP
jgi:hypothetical protein